MSEAQDVAQPLQRVLRAVGDLGAADEPFEQTDARREDLLFLAGRAFHRDADARQAGERDLAVTLSRASPGSADGYECGSSRTGAEHGGRRFQQ